MGRGGLAPSFFGMKRLYAGPFCGELGWEVATWQGHLRALAPQYDQVIVCCPRRNKVLYADFAYRCLEYDSSTVKANMWMNEAHDADALAYFKMVYGVHEFSRGNEDEWLTPADAWKPYMELPKWDQLIAIQPQKFIRFGTMGFRRGYDILYHARNRDDWDSGFRNWLPEHCFEVMQKFHGLKIAAIGLKDMAFHVEGTDDLRGISLDELADVLVSSKVLLGPVSGPTHFAALCNIPQVVWVTKQEHANRVKYKWNPFNAKVNIICADDKVWRERIPWTPSIEEIFAVTNEVLSV